MITTVPWAGAVVSENVNMALSTSSACSVPATAVPRGVSEGFGGGLGFSLRVLLPMALLVAGLVAIYTWQVDQRATDVEELDAQLLTDDLPIDAYLDRGFEAWLKKVSASAADGN